MTGYPDDNRPAFERVTAELRALGHKVVDPTEMDLVYNSTGSTPNGPSPLWRMFIARDVAIIASSQFDGIVVLPGWERSKGARAEVVTAILCGVPVFDPSGAEVVVTSIDFSDCVKGAGRHDDRLDDGGCVVCGDV